MHGFPLSLMGNKCREIESLNRMKADLDRAVGLQPVKDFEVIHCCQRLASNSFQLRLRLIAPPLGGGLDGAPVVLKPCTHYQHVGHLTPPDPEPLVQEFIVQRLRDAAGRHVLKEGGVAASRI